MSSRPCRPRNSAAKRAQAVASGPRRAGQRQFQQMIRSCPYGRASRAWPRRRLLILWAPVWLKVFALQPGGAGRPRGAGVGGESLKLHRAGWAGDT